MHDSAPENSTPSDAHVPWESIGTGDGAEESTAGRGQPVCLPLQVPREEPDEPPARGGGWTIPILCAGIAIIACCVLIPQADANRRLMYERQMLRMDLETVERQVAVNGEFLHRVGEDPTLAERLAERQMKVIPEGTRVLELKHESDGTGMSPFQLVSVAPPPPLPPYRPVGGTIATLCYEPHTRLYLIGSALTLMAVGLVLGHAEKH